MLDRLLVSCLLSREFGFQYLLYCTRNLKFQHHRLNLSLFSPQLLSGDQYFKYIIEIYHISCHNPGHDLNSAQQGDRCNADGFSFIRRDHVQIFSLDLPFVHFTLPQNRSFYLTQSSIAYTCVHCGRRNYAYSRASYSADASCLIDYLLFICNNQVSETGNE